MSLTSKRDIEKVCSYCGYEKNTVDREAFDGMCAECTDKALEDEHMDAYVKKANRKLKSGYLPYICWCDSTQAMSFCEDETCDGIFFWVKA